MYVFAIYARDSTEPPHRPDPIRRINAIAITKPLLPPTQQWVLYKMEEQITYFACQPLLPSEMLGNRRPSSRMMIANL